MLWKYKKCYQETNEDIIGTCLSVPTIIYNHPTNPLAEIDVTSKDCRYGNIDTIRIPVGVNGLGCLERLSSIDIIWSDTTTFSISVNTLPLSGSITATNGTTGETLEIITAGDCI